MAVFGRQGVIGMGGIIEVKERGGEGGEPTVWCPRCNSPLGQYIAERYTRRAVSHSPLCVCVFVSFSRFDSCEKLVECFLSQE